MHKGRERNINMKRQIEIQKVKTIVIEIHFGNCGSEKELEVKEYTNRKTREMKQANRIKPKKVCACERRA